MKHIDWNNVEEVTNNFLTPGGYICGITSVEDYTDKEFIKFEFDIADGQYKNYYRNLMESKGFWGGSFIKSYKPKALGFFKKMLICFEKSNKGFKFVDDETVFKRKLIGLVLGEEEYMKNSGEVGTRIYVKDCVCVDDIKKGNFKVPEKKTLAGNSSTASKTNTSDIEEIIDEDDMPF